MKPKFTPGPWLQNPGHPSIWARGQPIALSKRNFDRRATFEDLANAQLIAAAPEMYEALEAVEEYFAACRRPNIYQNPGEIQSITAETARMLVEKALKKARNEK